jgi:hypothetical protein
MGGVTADPRTSPGPRTNKVEAISNTTTANINARRDILPASMSGYKSAPLVQMRALRCHGMVRRGRSGPLEAGPNGIYGPDG